jgi:hypothetical protein
MYRNWDAEYFREFLQNHTNEYEPVFWSGHSENEFGEKVYASERADEFCDLHNTLLDEGSPEYKTVSNLVDEAGFDPLDKNIDWDEASQAFAEESSGQAHCFIGEECDYENNCWNTIERNAVINNENINNNVDSIDVSNGLHSPCDKGELPNPHTPELGQQASEGISETTEECIDIGMGY